MLSSNRREFLKNSMALTLAPAAGGERFAHGARAGAEPETQSEQFFKGFKEDLTQEIRSFLRA